MTENEYMNTADLAAVRLAITALEGGHFMDNPNKKRVVVALEELRRARSLLQELVKVDTESH